MDSQIAPVPFTASSALPSIMQRAFPELDEGSITPTRDPKELPGLTHFNRARRELELASSLDEVKQLRDKAEAMRTYARQAQFSLEMQNMCAEIKLRAERKLGEMLREANTAARSEANLLRGRTMQPRDDTPSLTDLGISKSQSSRCQQIASMTEGDFEDRVRTVKESGRELSTSDMVKHAKALKLERDRTAKAETGLSAMASVKPGDRVRIFQGDFRQVLIGSVVPNDSVNLLITDPPYLEKDIPIFKDLGEFAARVLKPGRLLITYTGNYCLPSVIELLSMNLRYVWTAAVVHSGMPGTMFTKRIRSYWKPVLIFSKGDFIPSDKAEWFADRIEGDGRNKENHDWEQGLGEAKQLIEYFTFEGDLVVDPFIGSGTNGVASKLLRRRFVGCDIDEKNVGIALHRIGKAE
jgi:hypothetical protein